MSGEGRYTAESGGFVGALTRFFDLIFAGFLWLLCSLPLISVGPASTALYYTVAKVIRRERGRLTASFFSRFKADFKLSLLLWLICLAYIAVGLADIWAMSLMGIAQGGVLYYVSRLYFLPALMIVPWLFAYVSRFDTNVGGALKAGWYLAVKNLWRTAALIVLTLGVAWICWLIPLITPLLPGVCCLLQSLVIEPVLRALTLSKGEDGNTDQWYNE